LLGCTTRKKPLCNCPNGSYVNHKGEVVHSLKPGNHAVNCRIMKNIQTEDEYVVTDSNYSGYQVANTSYTVLE
jgi:hypothetical protein